MFDPATLVSFIAVSLIVLLTPGPGVIYVVARSIEQGRLAGLISAVGLSVGVFAHVAAAIVGLSALLLASATAFEIVKLTGAAYLVYVGIQTLRTHRSIHRVQFNNRVPLTRLFTDGLLVSVFNPKIAVFFLAFLPQFVEPTHSHVQLQIALLGTLYAGLALATDGAYALLAGTVAQFFGGSMASMRWPKLASGSLLVGLGIWAALSEQRR